MTRLGILLFAHGARDPAWAQPFQAVAQQFSSAPSASARVPGDAGWVVKGTVQPALGFRNLAHLRRAAFFLQKHRGALGDQRRYQQQQSHCAIAQRAAR